MNARTTASRYHDFCAGHRVVGHESKCANLHGHNYRVHFTVEAHKLDSIGRVVDFSVIKSQLCHWLEENWDHKMLLYRHDPLLSTLDALTEGIVAVPFNPTAENMAQHLLLVIGPLQLKGTGARLIYVKVEETRKCAASCELPYEENTAWEI